MTSMTATKTAKKTAAKAAPKPRKTAPTKKAATEEDSPKTITFQGRTMTVVAPDGDQLGVWQRTIDKFAAMEGITEAKMTLADQQRVLHLNTRLQKIVASVLVDEDDKDWLDDQFLDQALDLEHAVDIIAETMKAYGASSEDVAPKNGPVARRRR